MINRNSLSISINTKHSPCISQISNIAHSPGSFLPDKNEAASSSSITGPNKFKLLISFTKHSGNNSLDIVLILHKFLLEYLNDCYVTLGITLAQYSLT